MMKENNGFWLLVMALGAAAFGCDEEPDTIPPVIDMAQPDMAEPDMEQPDMAETPCALPESDDLFTTDYTRDVTLAGGGCVYTFPGRVLVTGTMTIEAGATLRFDNAEDAGGLFIQDRGRLIAHGTAAAPIVFEGATGGSWPGIKVNPATTPGALQLRHAIVRGTSSDEPCITLTLGDEDGAGRALVMSDTRLEACTFGLRLGCALCADLPDGAGFSTFSNNTIADADYGVSIATLSYLNALPSLPAHENTPFNMLFANISLRDASVAIPAGPVPWKIGSGFNLQGASTLQIAAGAHLIFGAMRDFMFEQHDARINVEFSSESSFIVAGTAANPVIWDATASDSNTRQLTLNGSRAELLHAELRGVGAVDLRAKTSRVEHVTVKDCDEDEAFIAQFFIDTLTFNNNTVEDCTVGILTTPQMLGSFGSNNIFTRVQRLSAPVAGGEFAVSTQTWLPQSLPWDIDTFRVVGTLTLVAGLHLRLSGSFNGDYDVADGGALIANGLSDSPVLFSPAVDGAGDFGFRIQRNGSVNATELRVERAFRAFTLEAGSVMALKGGALVNSQQVIKVEPTATLSVTDTAFSGNSGDILVPSCAQAGITLTNTNGVLEARGDAFGGSTANDGPCP